jgi:hypothetical protein
MKRILIAFVAGVVLAGICLAQSVQSQASGSASQQTAVSAHQSGAQAATAGQLQAGSTVQAELVKPLDAHKNKVGDEVVAKTTHDVKSEGHVIVPKGSKLVGHVTEAKAHSKDQADSELGIAFDRVILKNGTEMPLALGIQAIGRSQANATATEDDAMMTSAGGGAMGSTSVRPTGGGGMVGGVRSTAGGVVNAAGSTAGTAVNTAGTAGGAVSGSLSSTSQGVVGLQGLSLSADTSNATHASVVSSSSGNVHLDSGTEMVLRVNQ